MKDYEEIDGVKRQIEYCLHTAYDKGYNKGYNKGIADGNINDGTFAEKVKGAYENGIKKGQVKEYKKGLIDAWECIRELDMLLFDNKLKDVFGEDIDFYTVVTTKTPFECINKLKEYKEKTSIKVGDGVCFDNGEIGVVVKREDKERNATVLMSDGEIAYTSEHFLKDKKTGRHYEIDKILNQMQR